MVFERPKMKVPNGIVNHQTFACFIFNHSLREEVRKHNLSYFASVVLIH